MGKYVSRHFRNILLQRKNKRPVYKQGDSFHELPPLKKNSRLLNKEELKVQMISGIENDEFELFYQPQWDLEKGRWCGMEVLVRWLHPEQGLIPPEKFVEFAENTGLIHPLGDWIIENACKEHVKRQQESKLFDLPISINISMKQLMKPNYIEHLVNLIKNAGLNPEHFVMELTESHAIDVKKAKKIFTKAKEFGVKISIDDFGTGYSSLSYISEFPVDEIKIDKSFVQHLGEKEIAILRWMIELKRILNVTILVEGVETRRQLDILKELGCDKIQGFYFSEPLPSQNIFNFLNGHNGHL